MMEVYIVPLLTLILGAFLHYIFGLVKIRIGLKSVPIASLYEKKLQFAETVIPLFCDIWHDIWEIEPNRFNNQEEYLEGAATGVRRLNRNLRNFEEAAQKFQFYLPLRLYKSALLLVAFSRPIDLEKITGDSLERVRANLLEFRRVLREALGVDRLSDDFERTVNTRIHAIHRRRAKGN